MKVSALLVSHDGARWLPAVLEALSGQTQKIDQVVAVDTGSTDDSDELLRAGLGAEAVLTAPASTPYSESVRSGLEALPPAVADEWVWLLHDDSAPAPDALAELLAATEDAPDVAVLGPKLREWPSLRRLLELGVTISGTGRRETGLERGEYDQGQHDQVRDVLAVNTAGMLVRREVLAEIGFDDRLPVFGNDIDFGWRAARAGHRTVVVPAAVVFHVEAAHRGLRRTDLTGRRFHRHEREAALYTLLVNGSRRGLVWRWFRLLFGSLLRMVGFLLVRAPGEAWDEVAALVSVYVRPHRIIAGRSARRRTSARGHGEVKHLLAPMWVPYRHGLDFVSDVGAAVVNQTADLTAARRAAIETGPVDLEREELAADNGLVARLVTSPIAWVFALLFALAAWSMRGHLGDGFLSGGALLPAPDGVGHWWSTAFAGWHDLGVGSSAPAPPYLLPLAVAGTVLLGKAWLVVDLIFFLAVPIAAFTAFRFLRTVTGSWPVALWGGVAYGLLPVLSGAVQQGRLGTVVTAMVLPLFAHAAVFLVAEEVRSDRRWRAAFRSALWLALASAFAPVVALMTGLVVVVGLIALRLHDRARFTRTWRPVVVSYVVGVALLLPWLAMTWAHQGGSSLLLEAGRPASELVGNVSALDLLNDRPGAYGAPIWLTMWVVPAALVSLLRTDTRSRVTAAWAVGLVGLLIAAVTVGAQVTMVSTAAQERIWTGVPLLVVQASAITAIAIAATGAREQLGTLAFGWRQPLGVVVAVAALLGPLLGVVWWGVHGLDGPLARRAVSTVPAYMTDGTASDPSHGVLIVRGSQRHGFSYLLLRERGMRLGDDAVLPSRSDQQPQTDLVAELASAPTEETIARLAPSGVAFVYAPRPVDQQLAGNLDSLSGLSAASALAKGSRAWAVDSAATRTVPDHGGALHPWLVALECIGVIVVVVLAAPTRRREGP